MAKKTIAKPEPEAKVVVRVKSTEIMRSIRAITARTEGSGSDAPALMRAVILLTALADGEKIKIQHDYDLDIELAKFENLALECDGMARVLSFRLEQMGVKHVIKQGQLLVDGQKVVPIHQWIELADGRIVDYRARMWAGNTQEIPHGIFKAEDFKKVQYSGLVIDIKTDEKLFKVLVTPIVPVPLQKSDAPAAPTVIPAGL
jgi:hypothetical protein